MVVRGPYINPSYLARFEKANAKASLSLNQFPSAESFQKPVSAVENIENAEHFRERITSGGLTVCFFTDSMFNPCRYYESIFKSVALEFRGHARFIRVDTDDYALRKVALNEEVRTYPTVSFYQSGLELVSIIGTNETRLRHFVQQYKPTVNGGEIATKKIRRIKTEDEFTEMVQMGRLSVAVFFSKQCLFCYRSKKINGVISAL
ncbi:Oidioi.mRNA.OKI2018_I69.XSR.g14116.t1.cds [Oikopleura dioica]|uniref:Oidioi.mRNA.OKI2018_I69.XSR.g14116.t1.cds n=1 Tax=Oikopleura dioica TaxID=34765 RepID=A0ABN7SCW7_OIKDI|nr:Oidioi.mRNA.OKI2018_I69.XSR.g14116.t1.cds [Oikopleura dioica]